MRIVGNMGQVMFKKRYPGCYPAIIGVPMWQRRFGFMLANLGNWLAGWPWGENHYMRGVRDAYEDRPDEGE